MSEKSGRFPQAIIINITHQTHNGQGTDFFNTSFFIYIYISLPIRIHMHVQLLVRVQLYVSHDMSTKNSSCVHFFIKLQSLSSFFEV